MAEPRPLVLVADDEPDIVNFIQLNLEIDGFDVIAARDGAAALKLIHERRPELVILDVMMPKMDGFEVCEQLRNDPRTRALPVIMLTAKSLPADKIVGLTAGADDYMVKPFDPVELVVRVQSALRRASQMRAMNPLTQLPGNVEIQDELARRLDDGKEFSVLYVDLDNFKAFNDHYGFARGDEAIKALAACISGAFKAKRGSDPFIGHIGGDDFIAVCGAAVAEPIAKAIIKAWDAVAPTLCDADDVERGYVEIVDRQGHMRKYPLTSVSVGIVSSADRKLYSHWEASEIATEMKHVAKQQLGSSYAIDRRKDAPRKPAAKSPRGARAKK